MASMKEAKEEGHQAFDAILADFSDEPQTVCHFTKRRAQYFWGLALDATSKENYEYYKKAAWTINQRLSNYVINILGERGQKALTLLVYDETVCDV